MTLRLIFLLCISPVFLFSQKGIYIPLDWQQGGLDYSFSRSAQSDNFIVFWGPLAGDDPTLAPADIAFDPVTILNTAEDLYKFYIDTIQFVNDDTGLIHQYKIILVMLHTWTGLEGWAFGGNYDGVVGAMWMHPHAAASGPTLAHEFTHTLQNYTWMMNPGHGFIDSSYVGFFWETHAEFMALQKYPSVALEFDMARWLNTCQFHWSSTRHHYQAFIFLQFIKEKDGIGMINRMWNESIIGEHPLETYKRLKGITQEELNDLFGEYAMRNVTWDYEIGDLLRERISTLNPVFVSHPTFIPEVVDSSKQWYRIQNHLAPQDYGYNIIRLYPQELEECHSRTIHIHLEDQTIYPDYEEAGLRFGFVALNNFKEPRYSELYKAPNEVAFELHDDESEVYLVVIGAPVNHHNYGWEIGFPKIYRYPYDFRIENAYPEGYQPGFHKAPEGIPGAPHVNGGGFVASTSIVAPTAYVGPHAQVLDQAQVLSNARIKDYAIVEHSAVIDGSATISGLSIIGENAHVRGDANVTGQAHVFGDSEVFDSAFVTDNSLIFFTQVHENAKLTGNTFCWGANLHGDVLLGGDAEFFRECDNGTYLQFESAYDRNCDGLDDHPANKDVTGLFYIPNNIQNQYSLTCDGLVENIFEYLDWYMCEGDTFYFYGTPLTMGGEYEKIFEAANGADSIITLFLNIYNAPLLTLVGKICPGDTVWFEGFPFIQGVQYDTIIDDGFCEIHITGMLGELPFDTTVLVLGNTLEAQQPAFLIQWYDCETNLPVDGAYGKTFTPENSGYYKARIITLDTCEGFTGCHYVSIVGTKEIIPTIDWTIRPNPANDFLEMILDQNINHEINIEIIDMLGVIIIKELSSLENNKARININKLLPGIYMIKINDEYGLSSAKLFSKI